MPVGGCAVSDAISNPELILKGLDKRWPAETVSRPRVSRKHLCHPWLELCQWPTISAAFTSAPLAGL